MLYAVVDFKVDDFIQSLYQNICG